MGQPYVGEIRIFAGNFPPVGWMFCEGALLPISENETLFQLIGTTFGGDGEETFALPNLASRVPIHSGTGPGLSAYVLAETGGTESVTLTTNQIPIHTHAMLATDSGQTNSPLNAFFATATSSQAGVVAYDANAPTTPLVNTTIQPQGGSQPHDNIQPTLALNYIISLFGVFPSQN